MPADGQPLPTAEGALIRRLRESQIPHMSIRAAAKAAGMSPENWGHVERGYQPVGSGKTPRPVTPTASTLARMASVVGASPERLEAETGRADAAGILREIQRRQTGQLPEYPPLPTLRERGWPPPHRSYGDLDHLAQTLADIPGLEEAEAEGVIRMTAESIRNARAAAGEERRGALSEASGS